MMWASIIVGVGRFCLSSVRRWIGSRPHINRWVHRDPRAHKQQITYYCKRWVALKAYGLPLLLINLIEEHTKMAYLWMYYYTTISYCGASSIITLFIMTSSPTHIHSVVSHTHSCFQCSLFSHNEVKQWATRQIAASQVPSNTKVCRHFN